MMKKIAFALTISTALAWVPCAQAASLSDSVSRALGSHPSMQARKALEDAAGEMLREQKGGYFPTLGATARAGHVTDDNDTTRAITGGDASSWLGEGYVSLTQPLFTGWGNTSRVAAAKSRLQSAKKESGSTGEEVALKAARAHLNLMRTRQLLDLATDYLGKIEERKKSIALMVSEGASDEAELLQADEILMAVRTTRLGYEEAFRQAEADYIEVVGSPPDSMLEFGAASWDRHIPPSIEDAVAKAAVENPRVQAAESAIAALGQEAKVAKSSLYPQVNAELSYLQRDQEEELGGEASSAQAMLKMSWSFSTGGSQLARVDRTLAERREAQAKRDGARRMAEHDVRQKYTAMQIVDKQYQLMKDRETAAEKIVANYTAQFEGGKQTNLQLINSNSRLFDAKAARTDAHYRRLLSRFELLGVMGRLRDALGSDAAPVKTGKR